jgi:4-amino-4-deoxy-L-arabinose transferase-like glycosyltransferase
MLSEKRPSKLISLIIPLFLFCVAFVLRITYLSQAEENDPNISVLLPSQDMYEYDFTARRYVNGDFTFTARGQFSTSTFYPCILALLYKVSGNSLHFVRVFQALLSSLTVVLLYLMALRFTGEALAAICGLVLAFYGLSIYFSAVILPATTILFFYSLMLLLVVEYRENRNKTVLALAALMLGVCIVARGNNIIILPFFAVCVYADGTLSSKQRRANVALVLLAVGVVPGLWALAKLLLAKGASPNLSQGLYAFLPGNTYDSTGIFWDIPPSAQEIFASSGESYLRGVIGLIKGILDHPMQWLWVEARKILAFWIGFEPANNVSYYVSREFSSLLQIPLPSFGLVSALGLLGMVAHFREKKRLSVLYLMTAGTFLSVIIFFILSRYRLIIVPTLILFSALAIERIWKHLTTRRYARAAGLVMAAIILLLLTRSGNIRFLYPDSYLRYFESMARHNAAVAFITQGKPGLGEVQLRRLLESDPHFPHAYATYALLCEAQGRRGEAVRIIEQGLSMIPSDKTLLAIQRTLVPEGDNT